MKHVLVYYGPLEENFSGLHANSSGYRLGSGKSGRVKPTDVDGIVFACMQDRGKDQPHFAVMADGVKLDVPVFIEPSRFLGLKEDGEPRGFHPSQITPIGEAQALELMNEIVEKNPRPSVKRMLRDVVARVVSGERRRGNDVTPKPDSGGVEKSGQPVPRDTSLAEPARPVVAQVEDLGPTSDPEELARRMAKLAILGIRPDPPGVAAPRRVLVENAYRYERDPETKLRVLQLASGTCEACGAAAPFATGDGQPFLEVHHVLPLSEDGPDALSNAVGICPNCHRALHLASDAESRRMALMKKVKRLVNHSPRAR